MAPVGEDAVRGMAPPRPPRAEPVRPEVPPPPPPPARAPPGAPPCRPQAAVDDCAGREGPGEPVLPQDCPPALTQAIEDTIFEAVQEGMSPVANLDGYLSQQMLERRMREKLRQCSKEHLCSIGPSSHGGPGEPHACAAFAHAVLERVAQRPQSLAWLHVVDWTTMFTAVAATALLEHRRHDEYDWSGMRAAIEGAVSKFLASPSAGAAPAAPVVAPPAATVVPQEGPTSRHNKIRAAPAARAAAEPAGSSSVATPPVAARPPSAVAPQVPSADGGSAEASGNEGARPSSRSRRNPQEDDDKAEVVTLRYTGSGAPRALLRDEGAPEAPASASPAASVSSSVPAFIGSKVPWEDMYFINRYNALEIKLTKRGIDDHAFRLWCAWAREALPRLDAAFEARGGTVAPGRRNMATRPLVLCLSDNALGRVSMEALTTLLTEELCGVSIVMLQLWRNRLGADAMAPLSQLVERLGDCAEGGYGPPQELHLSDNQLGEEGIMTLLESVARAGSSRGPAYPISVSQKGIAPVVRPLWLRVENNGLPERAYETLVGQAATRMQSIRQARRWRSSVPLLCTHARDRGEHPCSIWRCQQQSLDDAPVAHIMLRGYGGASGSRCIGQGFAEGRRPASRPAHPMDHCRRPRPPEDVWGSYTGERPWGAAPDRGRRREPQAPEDLRGSLERPRPDRSVGRSRRRQAEDAWAQPPLRPDDPWAPFLSVRARRAELDSDSGWKTDTEEPRERPQRHRWPHDADAWAGPRATSSSERPAPAPAPPLEDMDVSMVREIPRLPLDRLQEVRRYVEQSVIAKVWAIKARYPNASKFVVMSCWSLSRDYTKFHRRDADRQHRLDWDAVRAAIGHYKERGALCIAVLCRRSVNFADGFADVPYDLKREVFIPPGSRRHGVPTADNICADIALYRFAMELNCQFVTNMRFLPDDEVFVSQMDLRAWVESGAGPRQKVEFVFDGNGGYVPLKPFVVFDVPPTSAWAAAQGGPPHEPVPLAFI